MAVRDRTGEPTDGDTMFGPPGRCDRCSGHGWIEECFDKAGELLGSWRWDPAYCDRVERCHTLPCPRCEPVAYSRWHAGCWRTDGSHDRAACNYCQEDERRDRKPR